MNNYTEKELKIIKQCNEGPFYTLITELSENEFNNLVNKLINADDAYSLTSLIAIYRDYNREKIIDYFIAKGDCELLLGFLDYCNDFCTKNTELDQKSIVDKKKKKNDKKLIKEILESNDTYFLTNTNEKERLKSFISSIIEQKKNK